MNRQGQYEQAEEIHRQVLRFYTQAEEMHRQALMLRETVLGKSCRNLSPSRSPANLSVGLCLSCLVWNSVTPCYIQLPSQHIAN
jgi:hypothetical protein